MNHSSGGDKGHNGNAILSHGTIEANTVELRARQAHLNHIPLNVRLRQTNVQYQWEKRFWKGATVQLLRFAATTSILVISCAYPMKSASFGCRSPASYSVPDLQRYSQF